MTRKPREDFVGSWHHIFNRGLARRTVFELRSDIRYFLSRLAREVRAGNLEVHAFCFLTTHFHLLVRSPRGDISGPLARIQNAFVRRFNRQRKRDGSLFRGRFGSVPVTSEAQWQKLLLYIEGNAVQAGLVGDPRRFPHASASHYSQPRGPIWLERSAVEHAVCELCGKSTYVPELYRKFIETECTAGRMELVERRMSMRLRDVDPLDNLIHAATPEILDWMRRKARIADGTHPGVPVIAATTLDEVLAGMTATAPDWSVRPEGRSMDGWILVKAGLLRDACGLTYAEIGRRCGRSTAGSRNAVFAHRHHVETDEAYAARAAEALAAAVRIDHGIGQNVNSSPPPYRIQ